MDAQHSWEVVVVPTGAAFGIHANGHWSVSMGFINERAPEADVQRYHLREINERFLISSDALDWTVDRSRDVYLRLMKYDRDNPADVQFSFYWKGHLLEFWLHMRGEGDHGGKGSTTWSLTKAGLPIPQPLQAQQAQIIADLKDALSAFKDFGLRSAIADHTAHFEF